MPHTGPVMLFLLRIFVVAGALAAIVPSNAHDNAPPAAPSQSMTVSGAVERALTLRAEELRHFRHSR